MGVADSTAQDAGMGAALGGPWGAVAGGALGLAGGIMSANAQSKAAAARAAALRAQAQRRIAAGQLEANSIVGQGQMNQTSLMSKALSSGAVDRESLMQDTSLTEISNRAQYEANLAIQNSKIDAENIMADAGALSTQANDIRNAGYLNAASSILSTAYNYNSKDMAASSAFENGRQSAIATNLGTSTKNYRSPY